MYADAIYPELSKLVRVFGIHPRCHRGWVRRATVLGKLGDDLCISKPLYSLPLDLKVALARRYIYRLPNRPIKCATTRGRHLTCTCGREYR